MQIRCPWFLFMCKKWSMCRKQVLRERHDNRIAWVTVLRTPRGDAPHTHFWQRAYTEAICTLNCLHRGVMGDKKVTFKPTGTHFALFFQCAMIHCTAYSLGRMANMLMQQISIMYNYAVTWRRQRIVTCMFTCITSCRLASTCICSLLLLSLFIGGGSRHC